MRSTFSRTFFPAALLFLVAMLVIGASFQLLVKNYLVSHAYEDLENDADAIVSLASAYYAEGSLSARSFLDSLYVASKVSDADAVIFDARGKLVLCSDAPFGCEHRGWSIREDYVRRIIDTGTARHTGVFQGLYDETRYVVSVPIPDARTGQAIGIVMVSKAMSSTLNVLDMLSDIYLFVSFVASAAIMIIMSVFARRHSTPLREMAQAASDFGHGNLNARVRVRRSYAEEVEELALAFNNMASSLQKSEYQRQEFVANVSHELKTPMTTIGGYIDGILDGTIPEEKHRHYMQIVSDETKRLSRLVRSMLDISRLQDQGGIPDDKKLRFDMEECAGQVLITFEQKILQKQINVDVDMPEHPVYTFANQDYITQVVYNLLDNAVKFCPAQGSIGLRIQEGRDKIYVSVSNDGNTIPPEELPLVFDRFHKTDKSRTQKDGWGLGLYIVKTIVCSHGENISVSSKDHRTEFTFTLPLVNY